MTLKRWKEFDNIYEIDSFHEEFLDTVNEEEKKEPPLPRYQKWLYRSVYRLHEMGLGVLKLEGYEKLNENDFNIYAMRYPRSKLNTRVIFYCHVGGVFILLTAFNEKSSSDYTHGIALAKSRLKQLGIKKKRN